MLCLLFNLLNTILNFLISCIYINKVKCFRARECVWSGGSIASRGLKDWFRMGKDKSVCIWVSHVWIFVLRYKQFFEFFPVFHILWRYVFFFFIKTILCYSLNPITWSILNKFYSELCWNFLILWDLKKRKKKHLSTKIKSYLRKTFSLWNYCHPDLKIISLYEANFQATF